MDVPFCINPESDDAVFRTSCYVSGPQTQKPSSEATRSIFVPYLYQAVPDENSGKEDNEENCADVAET